MSEGNELMDHDEVEQLIYRILATEDEEIDCNQVFELVARYVDLEVSGEDVPRLMPLVYRHLVQCDMCLELHDTLRDLAVMKEQGTLPDVDVLLDGILADSQVPAVGQVADASGVSPASPPPRSTVESPARPEDTIPTTRTPTYRETPVPARPSPWFRLSWATAAIGVMMAIVFGAWGWYQASQMAQMRSDMTFIARADRAIWMRGTEAAPDAHGFLFVDQTRGRALMTIVGLDPLPPDHVYQVWIKTANSTTSAGTFTVGSDRRTHFYVDLGPTMTQFTSLAITPEPKGGSSAPTTSPVCVWGKQL